MCVCGVHVCVVGFVYYSFQFRSTQNLFMLLFVFELLLCVQNVILGHSLKGVVCVCTGTTLGKNRNWLWKQPFW